MSRMDSHQAAPSRRGHAPRLVVPILLAVAVGLLLARPAAAYPTLPGTIWTIAGDGTFCAPSTASCGDGPVATAAQLSFPIGVAVDGAGSLYIADSVNNKIRKLTPAGSISTIAGNGSGCSVPTGSCGDGPVATAAQLNFPFGVAVDGAGNVYFADRSTNKIRKLTPGGSISTIAGDGSECSAPTGSCGDGPVATAAQLTLPSGVAVDDAGNVYIADRGNHKIRKLTPSGAISTIAGDGTPCAVSLFACGDGPVATAAQLSLPFGVAVDGVGNVYIADTNNNKIRKLTTGGEISTVAGDGSLCAAPTGSCGDGSVATAAQLSLPIGLAVDGAGNVYIADADNNKIRKLRPSGRIDTIAGTGGPCGTTPLCGDGGAGPFGALNSPVAVAVDAAGRNVFIADTGDRLIRWIAASQGGTVAPPGPPG